MTETLYDLFIAKKLTKEEIELWLLEQDLHLFADFAAKEPKERTGKALEHVAKCLLEIMKAYHRESPPGQFLTAVIKNDLQEAAAMADTINQRVLYLYPMFLHNVAPEDYRERILGIEEGADLCVSCKLNGCDEINEIFNKIEDIDGKKTIDITVTKCEHYKRKK